MTRGRQQHACAPLRQPVAVGLAAWQGRGDAARLWPAACAHPLPCAAPQVFHTSRYAKSNDVADPEGGRPGGQRTRHAWLP